MNKESQIMSASGETSCCGHRGKALKTSLRNLLKTIKGVTEMTNHTLRDRIPRWWVHVNILTKLIIKKCTLYIKMGDEPLPNIIHDKKSVNSGHMSSGSKNLIIITTLLLLKTTGNKTNIISLKRTIRASLNFIDPLTSDWMDMWGIGYKIPRSSLLKSSNPQPTCVGIPDEE
jgi:hypothetical protein